MTGYGKGQVYEYHYKHVHINFYLAVECLLPSSKINRLDNDYGSNILRLCVHHHKQIYSAMFQLHSKGCALGPAVRFVVLIIFCEPTVMSVISYDVKSSFFGPPRLPSPSGGAITCFSRTLRVFQFTCLLIKADMRF